jgi:hypothetical protein
MPYSTYRAHNAISEDPTRGNATLRVALDRIAAACRAANPDVEIVSDTPVEISSYVGLWAQVHNEGCSEKMRGCVIIYIYIFFSRIFFQRNFFFKI